MYTGGWVWYLGRVPNIISRGPVSVLSFLAYPYILQPLGTLLALILIARKLEFSLNFIFLHHCAVLCDLGSLEGDKAAREKKERWATENKDYPHSLNSMVHFTGFSGQRERYFWRREWILDACVAAVAVAMQAVLGADPGRAGRKKRKESIFLKVGFLLHSVMQGLLFLVSARGDFSWKWWFLPTCLKHNSRTWPAFRSNPWDKEGKTPIKLNQAMSCYSSLDFSPQSVCHYLPFRLFRFVFLHCV